MDITGSTQFEGTISGDTQFRGSISGTTAFDDSFPVGPPDTGLYGLGADYDEGADYDDPEN